MLLLGALLGGRLLRGRPAGTGEARSRRIFDAAPHFFAAGFLAAGFLAAGFRLAAAMADVSPVPSEGARALAVDSRAAAPQNDATAGRTRARARPRNASARKPPAAPGSPRPTGAQTQRSSNWPDDPAARRGGRANQGSAVRAVSPISVGATAHVIAGNCGVVRRSEPRNPRADCALGHGVATLCAIILSRVSRGDH